MTGRTIRQFEVMKSSCCPTGAGVIAPKGTSRSLGTFIGINFSFLPFLLHFDFSFCILHSAFRIPHSGFLASPEILAAGLAEFLEFYLVIPTFQRGDIADKLGQFLLLDHAGHPGHGSEDRSSDARPDAGRVYA